MSDNICDVPLVDLAWQRDQIQSQVEAGFAEILKQTSFIGGSQVEEFEHAFARYSGVRHCVGVANGTDALELALRAVGAGPGNECILPVNTFVGTAEAVHRTGAKPVLVDVNPETLLLDSKAAIAALSDRTAAIIPVHLYGRLVQDVNELCEAAHGHGAVVLEDAAQAHGATMHGARAGAFGDIAATSFYPGKNLGAYGDGGAVLTNSDDLAETVRLLRSHGQRSHSYHDIIGFNSRLDTLQAVVLSAKLDLLDEWNAFRKQAVRVYSELLADLRTVAPPNENSLGHAWHLYVVRVPNRDEVMKFMRKQGIGVSVHYPLPVHMTNAFAYLNYPVGYFPEAEKAASEILTLPLFPGIKEEQQEAVFDALKGIVE